MNQSRLIAVIPAAGFARRLGDEIVGSKEALDVGGSPAAAHLLRRLAAANIDRAVIALRRGKWDVPEALQGDHLHGVAVAYVMVDETPSPAHTIAPALRLVPDDVIALAFPDVIYEPAAAFTSMLDTQQETGADVVLGLFPTTAPERVDMVELDGHGHPVAIVIKEPDRGLTYSWTLALWTPRFTTFLLAAVADAEGAGLPEGREFQIGAVVQAAIEAGLVVRGHTFPEGSYVDIGTPEELERIRRLPHL